MITDENIKVATVIVTITLAFIGYIITYVVSIILENRKSKLKFVSDQIQYLYGPLFALSDASAQAWESFRSRCRPVGPFFGRNPPPADEELQQWRLWMTEVFMPINLKIEKTIIENSHLIDGSEMPKEFRDVLVHVEAYKTTMKRWEENDFTNHTSYNNYPINFLVLVSKTYADLKRTQAKMIGMK